MQYRTFRENLPALCLALCAHMVFARVASHVQSGGARLSIGANLCFAAAFLVVLHGTGALYIGAALAANFAITHRGGRRFVERAPHLIIALSWAFCIALWVLVQTTDGFRLLLLPEFMVLLLFFLE
jgi:hypothetical protein